MVPKHKTGGRNNQGRITARHRGGGHKRMYRLIDFRRNKDGVPAKVALDPIRSEPQCPHRPVALCRRREALHPLPRRAGSRGRRCSAGADAPPNVGNCLPLKNIPPGMAIHNIELQPGRGGVLCRSAGVSATLAAREADWAQINLPSGEIRRVPAACRATIGAIGNSDHDAIVIGKAGRNRWKGIRPTVRGTAMNPIDHPHGGGEGRTKGGRHPVSPTGKSAKGGGTRKRRKPSNSAIIRRRRSRRYGQLKIR